MNFKDITGNKYNKLTVIGKSHVNTSGRVMWNCECDCGGLTKVSTSNLKNGSVKSCGCLLKQNGKNPVTHGLTYHPLYNTHYNMIRRCDDTNSDSYPWYGAKGIKVCDEWYDITKFIEWAETSGWKEGLTIDRIDSKGNYEPSNCQWITLEENIQKSKIPRFDFHFFQNRDCRYWMCHEGIPENEFSCSHCYCPLYFVEDCGGNPLTTESGIRDCSACTKPHDKQGWTWIRDRINEEVNNTVKFGSIRMPK